MLTVSLICVGKLREAFYLAAAAEYEKRLGAFCKFSLTELPEQRLPDRPSPAQIAAALEKEGELILSKLPKAAHVTALCVEGSPLTSPALATRISAQMCAGTSSLVFLIGGSFGLAPAVKSRADARLSMSEMTFPHHLARVMFLEQIYRAFTIHAGSDYHK